MKFDEVVDWLILSLYLQKYGWFGWIDRVELRFGSTMETGMELSPPWEEGGAIDRSTLNRPRYDSAQISQDYLIQVGHLDLSNTPEVLPRIRAYPIASV